MKGTRQQRRNLEWWYGMVQACEEEKCDLIFIGSHGRSGWSRLLLGSVTVKVLGLAKSAVLVYRVKEAE